MWIFVVHGRFSLAGRFCLELLNNLAHMFGGKRTETCSVGKFVVHLFLHILPQTFCAADTGKRIMVT